MPVYKVIHFSKSPQYIGCDKYHDGEALHDVANYIMAPRKNYYVFTNGFGIDLRNPALSMERLAKAFGKDSGLRLRHSILSFNDFELKQMGDTVDDQLAVIERIAWYAGVYYGKEYQLFYGIHPEMGHAHIHFLMSTVNYQTGLKYEGKKNDYYAYHRCLNDLFQTYFGWYVTFVNDQI